MSWLPPLALGFWGVVLLQAWASGRLNLLLRADFHGLVLGAGLALLLLALASLRWRPQRRPRLIPWTALLMLLAALVVLANPPRPSLSTLAANRSASDLGASPLTFLSPPEQRSLTDWVRLLRNQPDPALYAGEPVRVSGFVLAVPGQAPELARLLVRCCLADATPVGLAVRWPPGRPWPQPDQWLKVSGVMGVEQHQGASRTVLLAQQLIQIPEPVRPLEP